MKKQLEARKEEIINQLEEINILRGKIEQRIEKKLLNVSENVAKENKANNELSEKNIKLRIQSLADTIIENHKNDYPVLLSVLEGAKPFSAQLEKELGKRSFKFQTTSIQTSSYTGTQSGAVKVYDLSDKISLANRVIIILDEVCDTGKTIAKLKERLRLENPKAIYFAALVDKKQPRLSADSNPDYHCFIINPDEFIVGFGLDYDELLRWLPFIGKVDISTLPTKEEKFLMNQEKGLNDELKLINTQINNLAANQNKVEQHYTNGARCTQFAVPGLSNHTLITGEEASLSTSTSIRSKVG